MLTSTLLISTFLFASTEPSDQNQTEDSQTQEPWIKRHPAQKNTWELGVFGGLMPFTRHELFEPDLRLPNQGWKALPAVSPEFGLRLGYLPLSFMEFEAEAGILPTRLKNNVTRSVNLWTTRGHLLFQYPKYSIMPFVLVGGGAIGVNSPRSVLGDDVDPAMHFGGGVKINANEYVQLRLDLRDVVSFQKGLSGAFEQNTFEILVGLSFNLGKQKENKVVKQEIKPRLDSDKDGYFNDEDDCPFNPENFNGFEDRDGCPDEIPEEVLKFTGVIQGIHFEFDKDIIMPDSSLVLDDAVSVLSKYNDINILIEGHTDNWGSRAYNLDLSLRRSLAVKKYLTDRGIAENRIEVTGKGFDEPVASNATAEGRELNRRIEFHIIVD